MTSRTKKILIATATLLLVSITLFVYLMGQIKSKGILLNEYVTVLDERDAQEATFLRIKGQVEETATVRDTIARTFFSDESDSISFLSEVEAFAESTNLTLETQALNKVSLSGSTSEFITITFSYSGTQTEVLSFTKLLENIPYHSWLESFTLEQNPDETWTGIATLYISLKTP